MMESEKTTASICAGGPLAPLPGRPRRHPGLGHTPVLTDKGKKLPSRSEGWGSGGRGLNDGSNSRQKPAPLTHSPSRGCVFPRLGVRGGRNPKLEQWCQTCGTQRCRQDAKGLTLTLTHCLLTCRIHGSLKKCLLPVHLSFRSPLMPKGSPDFGRVLCRSWRGLKPQSWRGSFSGAHREQETMGSSLRTQPTGV